MHMHTTCTSILNIGIILTLYMYTVEPLYTCKGHFGTRIVLNIEVFCIVSLIGSVLYRRFHCIYM